MIILPIFNDNLNPTKLTAFITLDDEGFTKTYNVAYGIKTPYYHLPKVSEEEFKTEFLTEENYTFKSKELYKVMGHSPETFNDVNSSLWKLQEDPYHFFYDHNLAPYSRQLQNLHDEPYFPYISKIKHNENISTLIKASSVLDGELRFDGELKYKYFDHYTKGARFHDIKANSINIEAQKRGHIETKGVRVHVDMDAFHLRLIDRFLNINLIPREEKGHDWLIDQAYGNYRPENAKQRVFQAIYSENFYMVPCHWMDMIKLNYQRLVSPLGRRNISFNYKIQEYDVLEMSKIINSISTFDFATIVLYLYDGLMIDVHPDHLKSFLEHLESVIEYPFRININDKEIRVC